MNPQTNALTISRTGKLTNLKAYKLMNLITHKLMNSQTQPSQNAKAPSANVALRAFVLEKGGHLLSRIALQYHRRRRA